MAGRTNFDLQIISQCRARNKRVATAAGHSDVFVIRMNTDFHGGNLGSIRKRARSVAVSALSCNNVMAVEWQLGVACDFVWRLSTKPVDNSVDDSCVTCLEARHYVGFVNLIKF